MQSNPKQHSINKDSKDEESVGEWPCGGFVSARTNHFTCQACYSSALLNSQVNSAKEFSYPPSRAFLDYIPSSQISQQFSGIGIPLEVKPRQITIAILKRISKV